MKIFVACVVIALAISIYAMTQSSWWEDPVDCPACLGTGRLLPGTDECGDDNTRGMISRNSPEYEKCYASTPCPHCSGDGFVKESRVPDIDKGISTFDDLNGQSATVWE